MPIAQTVVSPDSKSRALLMGRYTGSDERSQVVRPQGVMRDLLDTVFTVRSYLVAAVAVVGVATLATASLVFLLSFRLRLREIDTMVKIGGARGSIALVLSSEVLLVLALGLAVATLLAILAERFGSDVIRALLLS